MLGWQILSSRNFSSSKKWTQKNRLLCMLILRVGMWRLGSRFMTRCNISNQMLLQFVSGSQLLWGQLSSRVVPKENAMHSNTRKSWFISHLVGWKVKQLTSKSLPITSWKLGTHSIKFSLTTPVKTSKLSAKTVIVIIIWLQKKQWSMDLLIRYCKKLFHQKTPFLKKEFFDDF